MNNKLKYIVKQFTKFAIVGLLNTFLNLAITYVLIFSLNNFVENKVLLTFCANAFGFLITTLNAYILNNRFVFSKTKKGTVWPLTKTYICYGSTFVLSFILTKIFTNWLNLNVFLIPVLSLSITVPLNFIINKFWSFS